MIFGNVGQKERDPILAAKANAPQHARCPANIAGEIRLGPGPDPALSIGIDKSGERRPIAAVFCDCSEKV